MNWLAGIIAFLAAFISSVAIAYMNNVRSSITDIYKKVSDIEKNNTDEVKAIHIKFESYAKDEDLKELRKEILDNQKDLNRKLDDIILLLSKKEDKK